MLGAGLGRPWKLPDWSDLLSGMMRDLPHLAAIFAPRGSPPSKETVRKHLDEVAEDPLLQADIIRRASGSPEAWRKMLVRHLQVKTALLERESLEDHPDRGAVALIARIVAHQAQAAPSRHIPVLTFNYDSLLDQAIDLECRRRGGERSVPVSSGREYRRRTTMPGIHVHHLHGYLGAEDSQPVLDFESYRTILANPQGHWSWDCLREKLHREGACPVFIGLSLSDPNLRLALSHLERRGTGMAALYLDCRPHPDPVPGDPPRDFAERRARAQFHRELLRVYDEVLRSLHLVPCRLRNWRHLALFLRGVMEPE